MNPLTEEEFVKKFQALIAGGLLTGMVSDMRDSPMARGAKVFEITDETARLLKMLFKAARQGMEEAKNLNGETPMPGALKMPANGKRTA